MTTSEKLVENATLTLLLRLLTPTLLSIAGFFFWVYIGDIRDDASMAASATTTLQTRVTVLESNQASNRLENVKFQEQVLTQLAETNHALVEQGKQIATLVATIEGLKERMGGR